MLGIKVSLPTLRIQFDVVTKTEVVFPAILVTKHAPKVKETRAIFLDRE